MLVKYSKIVHNAPFIQTTMAFCCYSLFCYVSFCWW